jgi:hypothetical protein
MAKKRSNIKKGKRVAAHNGHDVCSVCFEHMAGLRDQAQAAKFEKSCTCKFHICFGCAERMSMIYSLKSANGDANCQMECLICREDTVTGIQRLGKTGTVLESEPLPFKLTRADRHACSRRLGQEMGGGGGHRAAVWRPRPADIEAEENDYRDEVCDLPVRVRARVCVCVCARVRVACVCV